MNRIVRNKHLSLILYCSLAGTLFSASVGEAAAQTNVPLHVDPALLGLPPATKSEPSPPASPPADDKSSAEAQPVEPPAVENKPLVEIPSTEPADTEETQTQVLPRVPSSIETQKTEPSGAGNEPAVAPEVESPSANTPQDHTPASELPVTEVLPVEPAEERTKPEPAAPAVVPPDTGKQRTTPPVVATALTGPRQRTSASAPLYVDPALLGQGQTFERQGVARVTLSQPRATASPQPQRQATSSPPGDGLVLRASRKMEPLPEKGVESLPTFLSALRMDGEMDRKFIAEGEAELRKAGTVVNADRQTYWPLDDEVEAQGNVHMRRDDGTISGPKMRLRLEDRIGYFEQPSYQIKKLPVERRESTTGGKLSQSSTSNSGDSWWNSGFVSPHSPNAAPRQTYGQSNPDRRATEARGEAERIDFEGENQYRLTNNTFTTCPVGNDDWYVKTEELQLDYDYEVGKGKKATVYFKDVPFFYSPWLSFSLNNERKSGFLMPSVGTSSDSGIEYTQPYYWNIAPNMDATISPRLMSRRGLQLGGQFRYLNTALGGSYDGKVQAEILPSDRLYDSNSRHGISLFHNQTTGHGFSGLIDFSKVSDDDYYTDLSSSISSTSRTQLLQQGILYYWGNWWSGSVNFQQYQTLQPDINNPVLEQYRMLPQVTFNARRPDFYLTDLSFLGQYTNFTMREREQFGTIYPDGKRTVLYPQIALPYVRPGWYVTPKIGVNYRNYSLSGQAAGAPNSISVTLPVFSVDSGMTFERNSNWFGRDYTQTLEPRLYYLNIPYKNQQNIPRFDTTLADFNFAQIFSENQFSGWDRINNANQLTTAVTSRLIEPGTGNEIMRAMLGQRYYFSKNKVELEGPEIPDDGEKWNRSDILASFSGQILPRIYADTSLQYGVNDRSAKRYSIGLRYHPAPGKVLNAAYRYNRDQSAPVDQIDISGQWPLMGRWHGVGRLNYSFKDDGTVLSTDSKGGRIIESLAGLEYDGGCWVLRGVLHRQALTSTDTSTSFFIQLELNDFARVGSNPMNLLKRNIQGYRVINDPDAESMFSH